MSQADKAFSSSSWFFRTALLDCLACNGDAHAKNFSLRSTPEDSDVYELTPAYGLLSASLHVPNEMSRMALDLFKDEDDLRALLGEVTFAL